MTACGMCSEPRNEAGPAELSARELTAKELTAKELSAHQLTELSILGCPMVDRMLRLASLAGRLHVLSLSICLARDWQALRLAGGGTTNPAWRQLLADVLEVPLDALAVPGASARGAALLGARAADLLTDDQLADVARPELVRVATPGPRTADLADRRVAFHRALAALRPSLRH